LGGYRDRPEYGRFPFVEGPAGHSPRQADWALGTGHTGAGEQYADAMEADVVADGLAVHAYYTRVQEAGALAKGGDWAAYVMPNWAGRMAS